MWIVYFLAAFVVLRLIGIGVRASEVARGDPAKPAKKPKPAVAFWYVVFCLGLLYPFAHATWLLFHLLPR